MSFRAVSLLLFPFVSVLKRYGVFYTSTIPEVMWYEPLCNTYRTYVNLS